MASMSNTHSICTPEVGMSIAPFRPRLWTSEHHKMERFDRKAHALFNTVVAVLEWDAHFFSDVCRISDIQSIPTSVDADFSDWREPPAVSAITSPCVVSSCCMDWTANIYGVRYFLKQVWPFIQADQPKFVVVRLSHWEHLHSWRAL